MYWGVARVQNSTVNRVFTMASNGNNIKGSAMSAKLTLTFSKLSGGALLVSVSRNLHYLSLVLNVSDRIIVSLSSILRKHSVGSAMCGISSGLFLLPTPRGANVVSTFSLTNFTGHTGRLFSVVVFSFPTKVSLSLCTSLPGGALFLAITFPSTIAIHSTTMMDNLLRTRKLSDQLVVGHLSVNFLGDHVSGDVSRVVSRSTLRLVNVMPGDRSLRLVSFKGLPGGGDGPVGTFAEVTGQLSNRRVLLPGVGGV